MAAISSGYLNRRFVISAQATISPRYWLRFKNPMDIGETLYVTTPAEFRRWLRANHQATKEIWLVQYKKATGKPSLSLEQALEEAICFGWIDSYMKGIDGERYATRFSPRRPRSNWTETNKARARKLIAAGKMTPAGLAVLPEELKERSNV